MKKFLITNNPIVRDKLKNDIEIEYHEIAYIEILKKARDRIHKGSKLLTHPLSGSVKPNETPYKTLLLEDANMKLDMDSLMIIENAIMTTEKFLKDKSTPKWSEDVLDDFQTIDFSLINSVFKIDNNIIE